MNIDDWYSNLENPTVEEDEFFDSDSMSCYI